MILWLNKIGPYHNPHETYSYYQLPFCKPPPVPGSPLVREGGLGEILEGHDFVHSGLKINFKQNTKASLCSFKLDEESAAEFSKAIVNHYWYQMYLDDLPIWAMVGEIVASQEELDKMEGQDGAAAHEPVPSDSTFIYTHKRFSISYNGNQIIEVNLTSESPKSVKKGQTVEMTYQVDWVATDHDFATRFNRYLEYSFFEHQIHWFSIFNSFMMVLFLCGLVSLILMRTLRQDYAKYARDDDDLDGTDRGVGEDSGWKQVHGDVFRQPPNLTLFAALLGTGTQLLVLVISVIVICILATLYAERGAMVTACIVCYLLSNFFGGYVSGSYYKAHFDPEPSPKWINAMLLSAGFLPLVAGTTLFALNFVALSWGTLHVIPATTMVAMALLWIFVALPLTIMGTILGRQWSGRPDWPCRVNSFPRPIPEKKWWSQPWLVAALTGLLPFGSIFIEMYFIFTSFWNYKFYYVYGFMLLVYIILCIVTTCVTIVAVYFTLNSEDYRWPWMSFVASGSTALYVFLYR